FEAAPALVSSRWQRSIEQMLASTVVFDHTIVHTRLGDKELWIDPTVSFQRGSISALPSPEFGRALVLRDGETDLREIPVAVPERPEITIVERFDVQEGGRSLLEVRTTYNGDHADKMRARMAVKSAQGQQDAYQTFYADRYGKV